jgi:hypothetical protein
MRARNILTRVIFTCLSLTSVRVSGQKRQVSLNQDRNRRQLRKNPSIFMSNRSSHHIKRLAETKEEHLAIILMIWMMNFEQK